MRRSDAGAGYAGSWEDGIGPLPETASPSPDTTMPNEWYIDAGGSVEGPVSAAELRDRAAAGKLRPADSVSADRVEWVPAGTVDGLAFPTSPRQLLETVVSGTVPEHATAPPAGPAFSPLDSVPGYELQGALGTGACGVVFRAVQVKLNRVVALKT